MEYLNDTTNAKPRRSLAAGASRRDRFKNGRMRGSARPTTARDVGIARKTLKTMDENSEFSFRRSNRKSSMGVSSFAVFQSDEEASSDGGDATMLEVSRTHKTPAASRKSKRKSVATPYFKFNDDESSSAEEESSAPEEAPVREAKGTPGASAMNSSVDSPQVAAQRYGVDTIAADDSMNMDMDDMDMDMDMDMPEFNDYQETEEVVPVEEKTVVKQAKKRKARNISNTRRRRQTLKNIDMAKKSGLVDEIMAETTGVRRGRRVRTKPLAWWQNEAVVYERTSAGASVFLPTIKQTENGEDGKKALVVTEKMVEPVRKRKARTYKKRRKNKSRQEDSDSEEDAVERLPLPKTLKITMADDEEVDVELAKAPSSIAMSQLNERSQGVMAGKCFDISGGASGVLLLAPGAKKASECSDLTEMFYIASGATNCVRVKIQGQVMKMSKGDMFFVPQGTVYSIKNTSDAKPVKLVFSLFQ